ncbi:rho GTPase-activating protein 25 isoform X1 [Sebastes umbrosus]|uniref:rho GTPase-activating protein 25 isoform X1 n=1 Tax=Sebastes umbrosus TaxID=72105 RepID=UPI0018A0034F|nr:rho GTPase-activating protein 25 isoform X1 [Sebastes umbrosus]
MSLKLPRNWDFSTFKAETARIAFLWCLAARSRSVIPGEGGPSPGSPRSTRSMERPLKAGWLKKQQRSLVKNWQQRYFVLRGSTLTYHKDDKETTVQGVIQLRFSKVNEVPTNSDDAGKYLFEIIPRTNRDRERCPYVLMANSQSDMEEWVRTLRRVIGMPTSGVFGKSLMDTVTYEQRFGPHMVPTLVQKCVEFIKEHGLNEEGIFRLPGQDNAVKQFRDAFDAGERPSFPSDTDVHTVASLLKLYLRELPEPVVPWTQYQDFLDCTNIMLDSSSSQGWEKLEKQIALLPRINYNLLSYVCRFLFEVQLQSKVNKMNVENLATVMGINLLKPQIEDPITVMKATPQIQKLMTVMIRQHETLFPLSKDVLPSPPSKKAESQKNTPRSFVGWESAEMGDASLSESPEEEEDNDSPGPDRGNRSPHNMLHESRSPSTDDWLGSPRKRTQTLPAFNCPLTGMAAKADALSRWSHIQESVEEKSGTLSEDIFKILDLRSQGSLFGGSQISNKEAEDRLTVRRGSDNTGSSTASPQKPDSVSRPAPGVLSHQKSVGNLTVSGSVQQVNSKTEQKKDSQQLVDSLQQENKELKASVAELQFAQETDRRRVAALEICLRNAERSRDEALRRNVELQKDFQQFLIKKPQDPT